MSLNLYILALTVPARGNCRLFVVDLNWFGFADAYAQVATNLFILLVFASTGRLGVLGICTLKTAQRGAPSLKQLG
jgi:hypothetical protein